MAGKKRMRRFVNFMYSFDGALFISAWGGAVLVLYLTGYASANYALWSFVGLWGGHVSALWSFGVLAYSRSKRIEEMERKAYEEFDEHHRRIMAKLALPYKDVNGS